MFVKMKFMSQCIKSPTGKCRICLSILHTAETVFRSNSTINRFVFPWWTNQLIDGILTLVC